MRKVKFIGYPDDSFWHSLILDDLVVGKVYDTLPSIGKEELDEDEFVISINENRLILNMYDDDILLFKDVTAEYRDFVINGILL